MILDKHSLNVTSIILIYNYISVLRPIPEDDNTSYDWVFKQNFTKKYRIYSLYYSDMALPSDHN